MLEQYVKKILTSRVYDVAVETPLQTARQLSERLQARLGGGLAGHNGLRSIAGRLGSADFARLRVGVGRLGRGDPRDVADFVLAPFAAEDDAAAIVARAADAVESLVADGLEETQRRFN